MKDSKFPSRSVLKYLILITVVNISKFPGVTAWVLDNTESCANIYTETNFAGKQLKINHGDLILDLTQVYLDSPANVWQNAASSVKILPSCALKACSQRYLEGTCVQITNSENSLKLIDGKPVSSVSCTCAKNCNSTKCAQVKFGRNDCAKGFVEEGCNTCSGISVQFKPICQGLFGSYADGGQKIKSLAVKPGCKLIVNDARYFDGYEKEITGKNPKYNGKIESYVCACTPEALNQSALETNRQIPYTPMIYVPSTVEQITTKMSGNLLNHPGLKAALVSAQNGRSSRNAYILVIGMTGAGKSSSINFLFDNAEVWGKESMTSEVCEYRISVPLGEFGIQNSELRVIDTPGLGDTRGLESDAQILATLEEYLKNHEELNERIPNVILVFAKFSQNRFDGRGVNFVNILRGIDLFSKKLFNSKFSNIVVVLTHYMSDTATLAKNPWSRIQEFQQVIEDYTNFPKPIVVSVAENKPDDEGLSIVNNFYRLPNRELYPRNILEKIQQLTSLGGDPIGEAIIRTGFSHPEDFKITKITKPLLRPKNSIVTRYLNILTAANYKNYKVEETEVSKLLEKTVNESVHISTVPTDTLPYLQRILHVQNILKKPDVPKSKEGILRLLKHIRPTTTNLEILDKALGIKAPILNPVVLGKSFHALKDIRLPTNVFQFNLSKTHPSGMGYLIPDGVTSENLDMVVNVVKVFSNRHEYIKDRLAEINFRYKGVATLEVNFSSTKYGYNILPKNSRLVAVKNLIKFNLTENNAQLSSEFIAAVNGLVPLDRKNKQSIENWKTFFTKFGTHVVGSIAMGGVVTATLKNTKSHKQEDLEADLTKLLAYADDLINGKYNVMFQNSTDYSLEFHNGEGSILSSGELTKLDFLRATKKVQDWVESLMIHPGFIESTMTLIPISDIAKRVNSIKAMQNNI